MQNGMRFLAHSLRPQHSVSLEAFHLNVCEMTNRADRGLLIRPVTERRFFGIFRGLCLCGIHLLTEFRDMMRKRFVGEAINAC